MRPDAIAEAGAWVPSAGREELSAWIVQVLNGATWPTDRGKADDLLPEGVLAGVFEQVPTLAGRGWFLDAIVGLTEALAGPRPPPLGPEGVDNLLLLLARVAPGTDRAPAAGRAVDRLLRRPELGRTRVRCLQTLLALDEHRDVAFWHHLHDPRDPASTTVVCAALFAESMGEGFAFLARPEVGPEQAVSLLERLMPRVRRTRSAEQIWNSPDVLRLLTSLPPELAERARAALPAMPEALGSLEELGQAVRKLRDQAARRERDLLEATRARRRSQSPLFPTTGPDPSEVF